MTYPELLEAAWQEHLRAKPDDAPTVISLFAGCGGSSLGYSMAGFRELLAVEWDKNACETFRPNLPEVPMWQGDIAKLEVEEVLNLTGLEPGDLDVLDGSPPCQGFSTAGRRILTDSRNQLFREYVRLLRGLKPKAFIMENVSGMVKGKMKLIFAEIMYELKASGYKVSCRLMDAAYFNVPQHRQRVIFIGMREDLEIEPSHPKAAVRPFTFQDACFDFMGANTDLKFNPDTKTAQAILKVKQGERQPEHYSHVRLHTTKPSPTLCKDFLGYFHYWHPIQNRPLLLKEWSRLGSFPDLFQWTDKKNGCQCIGNSVPPLFMKAIAEHVKRLLNDR